MTVCSRCSHENQPKRRFCGSCGTTLEHRCVACGFPNALGDRFCGGCGSRMIARPEGTCVPLTLEVLDLGAFSSTITYDNLPPVSDESLDAPLDSGEFRKLFDL